jgi:S1-C subfamily serine protease
MIHIKIANIILVLAILLNLAMFATLLLLNNSLGEVRGEMEKLQGESTIQIQSMEETVGSLQLNTSQKLELVDALLEELEGNLAKVEEEGENLRSELDYASTINEALESVVVVIWTDKTTILGSAFLVSDDGYIMTADHVVDSFGSKTIRVKTKNGSIYQADIIERDNNTDTAILKINVTDHPYLEMGDCSVLTTGSKVFALGAPEGFGFSASEGIVSAVRSVNAIFNETGLDVELEKDISVIQTDAAITHGNSGGPLIDKRGKVVGINSFGITVGSGSDYQDVEGLNFAISIDDVKDLYEKCRE